MTDPTDIDDNVFAPQILVTEASFNSTSELQKPEEPGTGNADTLDGMEEDHQTEVKPVTSGSDVIVLVDGEALPEDSTSEQQVRQCGLFMFLTFL